MLLRLLQLRDSIAECIHLRSQCDVLITLELNLQSQLMVLLLQLLVDLSNVILVDI